MSEEATCYICYGEESEENIFVDPNPCNCRGTIKIHVICFDILKAQYDTCGICRTNFIQNVYKKYYYPSGSLREEGNYVDGKRNGLYQRWHENGQLMEEVNYVNEKMNGLYRIWHKNGQLMEEGNYVNGEMDGLHQSWWINGQLSEKVNYVNGIIIQKNL